LLGKPWVIYGKHHPQSSSTTYVDEEVLDRESGSGGLLNLDAVPILETAHQRRVRLKTIHSPVKHLGNVFIFARPPHPNDTRINARLHDTSLDHRLCLFCRLPSNRLCCTLRIACDADRNEPR